MAVHLKRAQKVRYSKMHRIYLDNACSSIPDQRTLDCAQRYVSLLNSSKSASDVTRELRSYLDIARKRAADFINCSRDEIALVQCTSHAMGIVANAIPMKRGDNVLICDLEYQASVACWLPRVKKDGIVLKEVKSKSGRVYAADFEAVIDDRTRAIVLASVQEINGFRSDVMEIADLARVHNCYLLVDGVQEVGALQVDVKALNCDFYCAGAKKWIGNPFGTGFLYIRKELAETLEPMYYSYFNLKVPKEYSDYITYLESPSRHPFDDCGVYQNATKFEIAAYANYLGALGLSEALSVQMDIGRDAIEYKIRKLVKQLHSGLSELNIKPCSPIDDKHMSSIVSFNFGFEHGKTVLEKQLVEFLQRRNIYVSLRSSTGTGGIRISPHYYNTASEIDALLNGIYDFIHEHKSAIVK